MSAAEPERTAAPRRRWLLIRRAAADGVRTVELHEGGEVVERRLVEPTWAALEEEIADMLVNTPWVRSRDLVPWARRLIALRERLDEALAAAGQEPRR